MIELDLQHGPVMDFLCRKAEGLQYREVKNSCVNNRLFIPSDLKEFIKTSSPHAWKVLLSKYSNNEDVLLDAIMTEIERRIKNKANIATFFNTNANITFEGEEICLMYRSGTELTGDAQFQNNIFSAVEEMSYTYKHNGEKQFSIRPDISFFLNGIFLGYMELKSTSNGQTAEKEGRSKVACDYLEAMDAYVKLAKTNDVAEDLRKDMLRIFEKSLHLTTSDIASTYVLRSVASFYDDVRKCFSEGSETIYSYMKNILNVFKEYPTTSPDLSNLDCFYEVMRALYSKEMIEKEILYYNFVEYSYADKGKSKKNKRKERTSNRGTLIAPRPKQKFGCDKIIRRVIEMLEHEAEPNYFIDKLRADLERLQVAPEKIETIIANRNKYRNNKFVYSLLLQYAAGFGKSNIIGWTALQLKDLRHQGKWAYDKVFIVVDRLQLRDQIDTMMMNMNIDKAMFVEVTNKKTFVEALTDKRRIVVVNIQKFMDIKEALQQAQKQIRPMRVAFLIDEIHRSNTGENHEEMMSVFDELQDVMEQEAEENTSPQRTKNLIVGFTATPSEKVLARFGEYYNGDSIDKMWMPFDTYSMQEAINDGFILDPTKHIIPLTSTMYYSIPEGVKSLTIEEIQQCGIRVSKEHIYSDEERMKHLAQFIVDRLVSCVFGKIRGRGKAMLAVTSIPIAIKYCTIIRKLLQEKCKDTKYAGYADAVVAIVYSDSQKYQSSKSMNDLKPEKTVIQEFKQAKNGLIIVVDKLQTGFDDRRLHTLFLDKEITDINAIQTISRVNRTCKYKDECHIIDMTPDNVNVMSIRGAFRTFCGMVTSDFEPKTEERLIAETYNSLLQEHIFTTWFEEFKIGQSDSYSMTKVEDAFRKYIQLCIDRAKEDTQNAQETNEEAAPAEDHAKVICRSISRYGSAIEMLRGIYDIDDKYTEEDFLKFWCLFCQTYRQYIQHTKPTSIIIDADFDDVMGFTTPGIEIEPIDEDDENQDDDGENDGENPQDKEKKKKPSKKTDSSGNGMSIFDMIKSLNEIEELKASEIRLWESNMDDMFHFLQCDETLEAKLDDENFTREEKVKAYNKVLNKYCRALNNQAREAVFQPRLFLDIINDNKEHFYDIYLRYRNNNANIAIVDYPEDIDTSMPEVPVAHTQQRGNGTPRNRQPKMIDGKRVLSLIIKGGYFNQIMVGEKTIEYREIKPTTYTGLIQLDEQGEAILDADCCPIPMDYDAVELLVGYNTDRNTALVEVTDITIELTGYVFDDRGHEYPHGIVSFHLGEVIEKNIKQ